MYLGNRALDLRRTGVELSIIEIAFHKEIARFETQKRNAMNRAINIIFALTVSASAFGCSSEATPVENTAEQAKLALATNEPNHVQGTFGNASSTITFDIQRSGANETASYNTADGRPILKTVDSPDTYEVHVLADTMQIYIKKHSAEAAAQTRVDGDSEAFHRMQSMPEYALITEVPEALTKANARMAAGSTLSSKRTPAGGSCGWAQKISCGAAVAGCATQCGTVVDCVVQCLPTLGRSDCASCIGALL